MLTPNRCRSRGSSPLFLTMLTWVFLAGGLDLPGSDLLAHTIHCRYRDRPCKLASCITPQDKHKELKKPMHVPRRGEPQQSPGLCRTSLTLTCDSVPRLAR
ncbi:hypothetical protein F5B19DRAFT_439171 [Rostrohypoxylon terebratum]|nr:hypothetical protein F5B19DRAFT_439171 [Rostrohypoxylon terebratum]